jgi:hypothetical protein
MKARHLSSHDSHEGFVGRYPGFDTAHVCCFVIQLGPDRVARQIPTS